MAFPLGNGKTTFTHSPRNWALDMWNKPQHKARLRSASRRRYRGRESMLATDGIDHAQDLAGHAAACVQPV